MPYIDATRNLAVATRKAKMSYVYLYILRHLWRSSATLYYPVEQPKMNTRVFETHKFSISYNAVYFPSSGRSARNDAAHESTPVIRRAAANIRAAISPPLRIDATPVGQLKLKT